MLCALARPLVYTDEREERVVHELDRRDEPGERRPGAGMETAIGGYVGQQLSKTDTESSEAVSLAAAVLILLFAFGSATAMALPIVTAGVRGQ